jgi:hypothetical protein
MTFPRLLNNIFDYILNPVIALLFAVALLIFVYGIVQFISSETADSKRAEGQRKIAWGLVGMFIMFSAYGIIHVLLRTFDIPSPGFPF